MTTSAEALAGTDAGADNAEAASGAPVSIVCGEVTVAAVGLTAGGSNAESHCIRDDGIR